MDVPHDDHHLGAPVRTLTAVPWQLLGGSLSQSMPTREANLLASASAHGASVADLLAAYATHASLTCRLRSAFHACMARAESANKRRRVGGGASSSSTSAPQPTTRAGDNAAWGAAIPLLAEALRTHGVYRGLLLDRIAKVLERAGTDAEELVRFSDVNASVAKDLAEEDGEDSKTAQRKKLIADVEAMVAERLAWLRGEVPEEGGDAGASSSLPSSDKFLPPPLAHLVEKRLAGRGDKVDNSNRTEVYKYLFREGVIYAKKDPNLPKHPEIDVPNLQVIKLLQSLTSRELVKEQYAWQHYYWYLKDEGIEYLREYLNLPEEIVPATLKKSTRPVERRPEGPGGRGPPGGRGGGFGRDSYRGGGDRGPPRGGFGRGAPPA
ncbi:ribosomal 40S subunit protein S10A [Pycnococcus provasolii]|uniref:Ribosomal 40S subunit protein S10A n=1 Tax=Pycnococcus provasolii TaxID=41880 RepID=A0A830HUA2_9CHLO|nr:ribosomal 40S subunit protein S10A [Pycnococcus provasolii]